MFKTQNLYQNDDRWKNDQLGNSRITFGNWGCLLTSATMLLNGIGYSETPASVNEKMKRAGGFQGALLIPGVMSMIWPNCVYRDMQPCESSPAPVAEIDAAIAAGKPVILQVDWNKQAGIQTHFVLVKEKRGDDYVLYDPYRYPGDVLDKEVLLTSRYKYNGATLQTEISAVLWFDMLDVPAPEPPPKTHLPLPQIQYTVYTTENELALRAQPSADAYVWKRLSRASQLISLEPTSTAKAKVGVNGQWLHVQDPAGDQGFVAAWYVSESTPTALPISESTPATALPPGTLMFVPTEELSFRSQPVITPETLIRRIAKTETLACVEPASQAIPKVGVTGQWLKMRDAGNREGYVAAWYVRYASKSGSLVTTTSDPAAPVSDVSQVIATAEGIALRKQPVVSDSTLIKRLPLGTVLNVTEANPEVKVGKNDQWLKVKDPSGTEGYVAAWFVAR